MVLPSKKYPRILLFLAVAGLFQSACITGGITPGDQANVYYTCRLKNGQIVTTTYEGVANDSSQPKSALFSPKEHYEPAGLVARGESEPNPAWAVGFERIIEARVARAIVGMRPGESQAVEVKTESSSGRSSSRDIIRMARVRVRPKEMRMALDQYTGRKGKSPEVGDEFVIDPAVPGKVVSVTDSEVAIRFSAEPGAEVDTPFGKGVVQETEDSYEIVIEAQLGTLVRTGNMVGRIIEVDVRNVTIDYSHPFGGEVLMCDVEVESTRPASKTEKNAKGAD